MSVENEPRSNSKEERVPLVSVIVPSYNHEKYIVECLESIDDLDYPRLELIVSDDCSRDETFQIAEDWARQHQGRFERTLVVRQEKNLGIIGNLQYLFDNAEGDYLALIASDDMFLKTAVTGRVKILEKNRKLDAVFANAQHISESGALLQQEFMPRRSAEQYQKLSSKKLLAASLILGWNVPGPVLIIRKTAVREGGSLGRLPRERMMEDLYMYIRLAAQGRLGFIDCAVAKHRLTPGSLGQSIDRAGQTIPLFIMSYKMNRNLVKGLSRVALETRLAQHQLLLQGRKDTRFYSAKRFLLRAVSGQLKIFLILFCAPLRVLGLQG